MAYHLFIVHYENGKKLQDWGAKTIEEAKNSMQAQFNQKMWGKIINVVEEK
tara:strand:+ start:139 stop:291 length:153 start_codon:yes stop_codon:yes gene_type:complete